MTASSRSALLFRLSTTAAVRRQRALEVALQELLRLVLAVRELQGIGELRLVPAGFQAPAKAADLRPQEEPGDRDADGRGAEDETDGPARGHGRGRVIGGCVVELRPDQAVEVGADRLVGGRQLVRERREGRGRLGGQARRAEQIADGGPLPDEQLKVGAFGRRSAIAGVQLLQR